MSRTTFRYDHTHVSRTDGSPAMMVSEDPFVLINEDGHAWHDDPEGWEPVQVDDLRACSICGRDDVVTEAGDIPRCSRHEHSDRDYEVGVVVHLDHFNGDDEAAWAFVDKVMQRCWETDHRVGMASEQVERQWHFAMLEDVVHDVTADRA